LFHSLRFHAIYAMFDRIVAGFKGVSQHPNI
jgi:hypothetical protein